MDKFSKVGERVLFFKESNHTYTDDNGANYRPVSNVINKYKVPFSPAIAYAVAKKRGVEVAVVKAEWKAKADLSIIRGNYFHNSMEILLRYPEFAENSDLKHEYNEILKRIPKDYEIHIEKILADEETKTAGTADLVLTKNKDAIIFDWKSNDLEGKKVYNNFLEPLSHLPDTKLNAYTIQMNIYRYLKEKEGFKVLKLFIGNWQQNDMCWVEVERMDDEVIKSLLTGEFKSKTLTI